MNKKQLKKYLSKFKKQEQLFVMFYEREDGDRLIVTLDEETKQPPLTDAEWLYVLRKLNQDDNLWQEAYNAFHYYTEQVLEERKKAVDVNSQ